MRKRDTGICHFWCSSGWDTVSCVEWTTDHKEGYQAAPSLPLHGKRRKEIEVDPTIPGLAGLFLSGGKRVKSTSTLFSFECLCVFVCRFVCPMIAPKAQPPEPIKLFAKAKMK